MIGVERLVSWQSVMVHWPCLYYHDTSAESDDNDIRGDFFVVVNYGETLLYDVCCILTQIYCV